MQVSIAYFLVQPSDECINLSATNIIPVYLSDNNPFGVSYRKTFSEYGDSFQGLTWLLFSVISSGPKCGLYLSQVWGCFTQVSLWQWVIRMWPWYRIRYVFGASRWEGPIRGPHKSLFLRDSKLTKIPDFGKEITFADATTVPLSGTVYIGEKQGQEIVATGCPLVRTSIVCCCLLLELFILTDFTSGWSKGLHPSIDCIDQNKQRSNGW